MMRALWMVVLLSLVAACDGSDEDETPSTAGVATGEIGLSIQLRSNGAIAQLFVTPVQEGALLLLAGGDSLVGGPESGAEETLQAIEPARNSVEMRHAAQFETSATRFVVGLVRGSGERVDSTVDLPAPFELTAPSGSVSRADPIEISWDAVVEPTPMAVVIDGACIQPVYRQLHEDPGAYTIQPADLFVDPGTEVCTLEVQVTRAGSSASFAAELGPSPAPLNEQIRSAFIETVP